MRTLFILLAAYLLGGALAVQPNLQRPLLEPEDSQSNDHASDRLRTKPRPLKGRFLHITDLHPDPFYKPGASTDSDERCHGGSGAAGYYGSAGTSCDSPLALINATFAWIKENLKDEIDFVIWTGDSARHDNDERIPRDREQVTKLNAFAVDQFRQAFGKGKGKDTYDKDDDNDDDPTDSMTVPVVPTIGNNDILPHNVFFSGPNRWTRTYLKLWEPFIPEAQRHGFAAGGWFFREVIPNQLAVFSLNALYFFDHNSAVDGCASKHEPGYRQFEWLRIQLQFLRRRGMKAILIGHVPPARTNSKQSWDETCWQKYALWMRQYRDVVVGSAWGHMNIDHFMLQDHEEVEIAALSGAVSPARGRVSLLADGHGEMTVQSSTDYLVDLRKQFKHLPRPPKGFEGSNVEMSTGKKKKKLEKYLAKIGGEFAERFSLGLVSPSVVPNYYPTLRIVSYNISGLEPAERSRDANTDRPAPIGGIDDVFEDDDDENALLSTSKFKKPKGPSKSTPPGPAYSPQPLTWTGYQQLFCNLTALNAVSSSASVRTRRAHKPRRPRLTFELEYDTHNDSIYRLDDLTVRSYLRLAQRLGRYKPPKKATKVQADEVVAEWESELTCLQRWRAAAQDLTDTIFGKGQDKKEKKKKKKQKKRKKRNRPWLTFMARAFVGAREVDPTKLEVGEDEARLVEVKEEMEL